MIPNLSFQIFLFKFIFANSVFYNHFQISLARLLFSDLSYEIYLCKPIFLDPYLQIFLFGFSFNLICPNLC